jgi:hypothetical protein
MAVVIERPEEVLMQLEQGLPVRTDEFQAVAVDRSIFPLQRRELGRGQYAAIAIKDPTGCPNPSER